MCGRTACTLSPEQICAACQYTGPNEVCNPVWKEGPPGSTYSPSYNLAPTDYCPVMFSSPEPLEAGSSCGRVIQPMKWGLIPSYWKKSPDQFPWKMINSRSEALLEKATYKKLMEKGQRCVVLSDGFYEWQKIDRKSQPYFLYFPENAKIQWTKPELEHVLPSGSWSGRRLLTMAGLFDSSQHGQFQSFSVITVDSSPSLAFMHDRMPAILDGEECIRHWLDKNTTVDEALTLLKPIDNLLYHKVGSLVNNAGNKSPNCIEPVFAESKSPQQSTSQKTIRDFFPKTDDTSHDSKKAKTHK